jgi:Trehalose utilisation
MTTRCAFHRCLLAAALLAAASVMPVVPAARAADKPDMFNQSDVPLEVDTHDPALTKIVLVAGSMSPGKPPGGHEYFAGCALLMDLLKQTPGVFPVMCRDGWPKNEAIFHGAKAVVFYSDGGGKQAFLASPARIARVQKLVDDGVGIVQIHQAVDYPAAHAAQATGWLGGVWLASYSKSNRGHWESRHESFPTHPVTRGVTPWSIKDGWLGHIRFVAGMKGVTPLVWSSAKYKGSPEGGEHDIVGWTYDRPGGGRSFAFTGLDSHSAWALPGMRQFVVNGVLWSAGLDIPEHGAPCQLDTAMMNRHFDTRPKQAAK